MTGVQFSLPLIDFSAAQKRPFNWSLLVILLQKITSWDGFSSTPAGSALENLMAFAH